MGHYRKKPMIVEAVRFDGCDWEDEDSCRPMFDGSFDLLPDWLVEAMAKAETEAGAVFQTTGAALPPPPCAERLLSVVTLEGTVYASPGDWIIQGTAGELYPCKPDIFLAIYDPIDAASADAMFGADQQEVIDPPGVGRTELSTGEEEATADVD